MFLCNQADCKHTHAPTQSRSSRSSCGSSSGSDRDCHRQLLQAQTAGLVASQTYPPGRSSLDSSLPS